MAQILEALLDSQLVRLVILLGICLFTVWLLLSAKRVVPLTRKDTETLWKVHKQKTLCRAESWKEITRRNKIIGFECECGHRHVQKKPVVAIGEQHKN
jgi:hypothetical protein